MKKTIVLSALAAFVAGCATPKYKKVVLEKDKQAAEQADLEPAYVPGVDVTEASIRGSEFAETADLAPILFDYDSSLLKGTALEALKKNAEYLKAHKDLEVLVAGYCDDRGTIEYNLALGQKRSKEVREYYIRLGVAGKSLATISYGKESQSCAETTEDCWSKNRRAETRIRARMASNGHSPNKNAQ